MNWAGLGTGIPKANCPNSSCWPEARNVLGSVLTSGQEYRKDFWFLVNLLS